MKKGTYDVRMGNGDLVSVTAWEFELFGLGTLIVHRDVEYDKQWTVSEPRCGATFTRLHDTRKGAIEKATAMVHQERVISQDAFEFYVNSFSQQYIGNPTKYLQEKGVSE